MSQVQMGKPSLPSIQFLLQEGPGSIIPPTNDSNGTENAENLIIPTHQNKRQFGHRASRSVSSLPLDLQSLSLQAPEERLTQPFITSTAPPSQPYGGIPFSSTEKPPSWMLPSDRPPIAIHYTPPPITPSSQSVHKRRSAFSGGHGRSVSEFTLPPISSTPPSTSTTATNTTTTTRRHTPSHSHRRAVSANTIDFMLSPSPNAHVRAKSYSPKEPSLNGGRQSPPNSNLFDQLHVENGTISATNNIASSSTNNAASDTPGRYVCPYCHKKFSRPSSLRIHTYSHTGEKPFVCTEPGCGRHFSVQSNMRRHLRVHRLGRTANNKTLEATQEEKETA
ncbi:hypothetical protein [Parasitella parasitica]|uniref:C2H2-type domain-containing protein n=1 Tax=Parasitella parasitica TaxID=35722 RepID=A0A0B7NAE6_9FUNG|nr:hypothetical protein [Parasitella parasitica]